MISIKQFPERVSLTWPVLLWPLAFAHHQAHHRILCKLFSITAKGAIISDRPTGDYGNSDDWCKLLKARSTQLTVYSDGIAAVFA
ncbi:hypothetical protein E2C01_096508 [Portunus trituberculatus]|uniref:Uncharacterized protein n=1 Tax=Portunus trituberculatus TaxID=210409 RepID=A0A5B7K706_PORTR|nr:hypothetical protein [Portunus trituberculatus]